MSIHQVFGQQFPQLDSIQTNEFIDSLLIDRDLNNWSLRVFTNQKEQGFQIENSGNEAKYSPNNKYGVGVGFANKKWVLDIAFNIKEQGKEKTNRFDFQGSFLLRKRHVFDFFIQDYQGFNLENNIGVPSAFRKDIESVSVGLNYLYLFNYENFSISTLRSGSVLKNKTTTTFGLGAFVISNNIEAHAPLIPDTFIPYFNDQAQITDIKSIGGGILASFSTLFALPNNFFASISINPGIGLGHKKIENLIEIYNPNDPVIYKLGLFFAVGYNGENYYINLNYGRNYASANLDYNNTGNFNLTNAKLVFGYNWKKKKAPPK